MLRIIITIERKTCFYHYHRQIYGQKALHYHGKVWNKAVWSRSLDHITDALVKNEIKTISYIRIICGRQMTSNYKHKATDCLFSPQSLRAQLHISPELTVHNCTQQDTVCALASVLSQNARDAHSLYTRAAVHTPLKRHQHSENEHSVQYTCCVDTERSCYSVHSHVHIRYSILYYLDYLIHADTAFVKMH